eukprot:TRINITY_DN17208_c0_g1_i3.p2 TRINITY_DN17208_c0_g1~~TRINITY_DN17208_c0_g1_i3.p2  ORF type:complete len:277 (-),score=33.89 TRINITY_DN17208_c0_g1_i3:356-1186(-)
MNSLGLSNTVNVCPLRQKQRFAQQHFKAERRINCQCRIVSMKSEATMQLERLQQAKEQSQLALEQIQRVPSKNGETVDIRMYDQLRNSRNRLGKKLSEANQYISFLESSRQQSYEDITSSYDFVVKLCSEFGSLARSLESVAGSAQYGLDKQEALQKLQACADRFQNMELIAQKYKNEIHKNVPQKVSIRWSGVASEVRVMGDFDNWSAGQELSREDSSGTDSDTVFGTFETDLELRPGTYRIKLLVDNNKWQLAPDWPSEIDEQSKETNNIITID